MQRGSDGTQLLQRGTATSRNAHLHGNRHRHSHPESLAHCEDFHEDQQYCESLPHCNYTEAAGLCHVLIAWFHVMKTGGSFGTTLAHHANSSLPERAHMPSGTDPSDIEDVNVAPPTPEDEERQGEDNFFNYKYPYYIWFKDVFWHDLHNPGNHVPIDDVSFEEWSGNFYGMLRHPEERMVSSFLHFADGQGDIRDYSRRLWGAQTKMLSGRDGVDHRAAIHCEFEPDIDSWAVPVLEAAAANSSDTSAQVIGELCNSSAEDNVELALERLSTGFAFVGLTEQWDLSICLFHRMFDTPCLEVEFENMRPSNSGILSERDELLSLIEEDPDPWDNVIYERAEELFWGRILRYDVTRESCSRTCNVVPEVWQKDEKYARQEDKLSLLQATRSGRRQARRKELIGEDPDNEYDWPGRLQYSD